MNARPIDRPGITLKTTLGELLSVKGSDAEATWQERIAEIEAAEHVARTRVLVQLLFPNDWIQVLSDLDQSDQIGPWDRKSWNAGYGQGLIDGADQASSSRGEADE